MRTLKIMSRNLTEIIHFMNSASVHTFSIFQDGIKETAILKVFD
jgi:hypothetical protein